MESGRSSGCRLVGEGQLAGDWVQRWECQDVDEGDPFASTRLLADLVFRDARLDSAARELGRRVRGFPFADRGPALQRAVQDLISFQREPGEVFRSPRVTASRGRGDCDDSTRFLCAAARVAGVPWGFGLLLDETGQPAHVWGVLWDGRAWRAAETTVAALWGEEPREAMRRIGIPLRSDMNHARSVRMIFDPPASGAYRGGLGAMGSANTTTVEAVQSALGISADGVWGSGTIAAVKAWQTSKGFTPTGLLEPNVCTGLGVAIPSLSSWAFLGSDFVSALQSNLAGVCDPLDACRIMLHESGLQPTADNGVAVGIFQLLIAESGAGHLSGNDDNVRKLTGLSRDAYKQLTAAQQVPFAAKFWKAMSSGFGATLPVPVRDLYWLLFLPATYIPGSADTHIIAYNNNTYVLPNGHTVFMQGVYSENSGLDHGSKGNITAGDMALAANDGATQHPALYCALASALGEGGGSSGVGLLAGQSLSVLGILLFGAMSWGAWEWWKRSRSVPTAAVLPGFLVEDEV